MARYRVLTQSFINDRTVHPGEVIEYGGEVVADNLELIDEPKTRRGKPAKGEAEVEAPAEVEDIVASVPPTSNGEDLI